MEDEPPEDNKFEVMHQLLCMACLRTGPALENPVSPILKQYYMDILGESLTSIVVPDLTLRICWDCNALLKKSVWYREQVKKSFEKLYSSLQMLDDVQNAHSVLVSELKNPPRLQKCQSHSIHIQRLNTTEDSETEEDPIQVKEEIQDEIENETDSTQLLCMACLSVDTLKNIMDKTLNQYFMDILKQTQAKNDIDAVTPIICWQCHGLLRKVVRFRDQLKSSYQLLHPSLEMMQKEDNKSFLSSGVSRPPRLQLCSRDAVDIQPCSQDWLSAADEFILPDQPLLVKQEQTEKTTTDIEIEYRPVAGSTDTYKCKHCSKVCKSRSAFKYHINTHAPKENLPCPKCERVYTREYTLNVHLRTHLKREQHQCSQCPKAFRKQKTLDKHMLLHKEPKPFKCVLCTKGFKHKGSLKTHMTKHEDKPYHCAHCSKSFHLKNNLLQHLRTHTGEKPFKCRQCPEAFRHKPQLLLHMAVHTGDLPFACSYCPKSFSQSGKLKEHMRAHTGENQYPHQCRHCPKAFRHNYSLNIHMRLHTGERPFQCNECMKSFTRRVNILKHLKVHAGSKDFQCRICSKSYTKKYYLAKHMEEIHEIPVFSCLGNK